MRGEFGAIEALGQTGPLLTSATTHYASEGSTIAQIVTLFDIPDRYMPYLEVHLNRGEHVWSVPRENWARVRPVLGTRVEVRYKAPEIAAVAPLVSFAVGEIAAAAFAAGTLGNALVTMGASIVAGLALQAIIPPPDQPRTRRQPEPSYSISGSSNAHRRYGIYPKVLGRHRMFPLLTATGYTETIDEEEIYYRGRMTFGWGPLALEDLKIGTTPIHQFSDVELEFVNVDQTETLSLHPQLAGITRAWRSGSAPLEIYPDDIAQDSYSVKLTRDVAQIRNTRENSKEASVDFTWPTGIGAQKPEGDIRDRGVATDVHYRLVGGGSWTLAQRVIKRAQTRDVLRQTVPITFPSEGEYEIRVTFLGPVDTDGTVLGLDEDDEEFWDTYLTAIRSIRSGELPSHPNIAEVAFKIRATDQLNGQIDSLNATVHQMAPAWNGVSWVTQRVRHPAWVFLEALRGSHMANPVSDSRIDIEGLKAWAAQEPHWRCDYVVDDTATLRSVLDIVAATGRAKRTMTDMLYGVVRDGAAGPVRHMITPRNSWGFGGEIVFRREIHALLVRVRSERNDYEFDEIIVYRDGYHSGNATKFETLDLPGVVIGENESDQGNAWRLARYFLAVIQLRPEVFSFNVDWEQVAMGLGDKIQLVHQVASIGVGESRVRSVIGNLVTLDGDLLVTGSHRLTGRLQDGTFVQWTATGSGKDWSGGGFGDLQVGDLVVVEEIATSSMEVLITSIVPDVDHSARITAVPASPAVLTADSGVIPNYDPSITLPTSLGPPSPVVVALRSDDTTMERDRQGLVSAHIVAELQAVASNQAGEHVEMRVRKNVAGAVWSKVVREPYGKSSIKSDKVEVGAEYRVNVRSLNAAGKSRGWVDAGTIVASVAANPPSDVTNFQAVVDSRSIEFSWEMPPEADLKSFEIRRGGLTWEDSTPIVETGPAARVATAPAKASLYWIKAKDFSDRESVNAASVEVLDSEVRLEIFDMSPQFQELFGELLPNETFEGLTIAEVERVARDAVTAATDLATEVVDEAREELKSDVETTFGPIDPNTSVTLVSRVETAEGDVTEIRANITTLEAAVGGNIASISNIQSVKVDEAGAVAAIESAVSASYNNVQAWATATQIAKATRDEILAGHIFRVNGGRMELVSISDVDSNGIAGATRSTILLDADIVQITGITQIDTAVIASLVASQAFIDNLSVTDQQISGTLTANKISFDGVTLSGDGQGNLQVRPNGIGATRIITGSSTITASAVGGSANGDNTWKNISSLSIGATDEDSNPIFARYLVIGLIEQGFAGQADTSYRLRQNGSIIDDRYDMAAIQDFVTFAVRTSGTGTIDLDLEWRGANTPGSVTAFGRLIVIGSIR